jgi:hypothetical protein
MMINAGSPNQLQERAQVESPDLGALVSALMPKRERPATGRERQTPRRLNLDQKNKKNGLAQLVLTVVKLLHELLEKQAIHRIDGGGLTDDEIERLGFTLMRQSEEIQRISREFGLKEEDLNLDLGPLGKLL